MSHFTPIHGFERLAMAFALCLAVSPIVTVVAGVGIL